jgi:hypothetical protein
MGLADRDRLAPHPLRLQIEPSPPDRPITKGPLALGKPAHPATRDHPTTPTTAEPNSQPIPPHSSSANHLRRKIEANPGIRGLIPEFEDFAHRQSGRGGRSLTHRPADPDQQLRCAVAPDQPANRVAGGGHFDHVGEGARRKAREGALEQHGLAPPHLQGWLLCNDGARQASSTAPRIVSASHVANVIRPPDRCSHRETSANRVRWRGQKNLIVLPGCSRSTRPWHSISIGGRVCGSMLTSAPLPLTSTCRRWPR